jgi:2-polyprenyl-6-methoxyphenol hydroxylase-like FAD-dependent oxidoreductase
MRVSESPARNTRILIAGAGIAGPTLAYWLARSGFTPTLIEHAPAPRTGGYMLDFWGVGYDVAERMDLLPALRGDSYPLYEVRIVDRAGKRVAGFDARVFDAASHGRFLSIPRGDLARRIYDLVPSSAETIFGDSIAAIREGRDGVTVSFSHAADRQFDLVVGADGLHSAVRRLAITDGRDDAFGETYLGYYAAAFSVDHYPHRDEGVYVSYATPGRQVARYALRNDRSAFLLVFASDEPLKDAAHGPEAQRAQLRTRFAGAGWECDEIMRALDASNDLYFDAMSQMRLPYWSRGRVALVGDAAYCPSLLAGQGSAFAMAGAYLLAHALSEARGDYEVAFAEYERRFKPFVEGKQDAAKRFGGWFAPRTRLGVRLRNVATNVMGWPIVGNFAARRGFIDRFELPR